MNANSNSRGSATGKPAQLHLGQLRIAIAAGSYEVPAEEVATALVRWHTGFWDGRLPHEAAPLAASAI